MKRAITERNIILGGTYKTPIGNITITMLHKKVKGYDKDGEERRTYSGTFYLDTIDMSIDFLSIHYINKFIKDNIGVKTTALCCKLREVEKCEQCCRFKQCRLGHEVEPIEKTKILAEVIKYSLYDYYNIAQFLTPKVKEEAYPIERAKFYRAQAEAFFKSHSFIATNLNVDYLKEKYLSQTFVYKRNMFNRISRLKEDLKLVSKKEKDGKTIETYKFKAEFNYTYKFIYEDDKLIEVTKTIKEVRR